MMGVDRLLQSMTGGGDRAGSRWKLPALLYSYKGLYSIYIVTIDIDLESSITVLVDLKSTVNAYPKYLGYLYYLCNKRIF